MIFKKSKRIKNLEREKVALSHQLLVAEGNVDKMKASLIKAQEYTEELEQEVSDLIDFHMTMEVANEIVDDTEPKFCSCGGEMIPMYEENPGWIKFCRSCNATSENTSASPIVET